ncbi:MAG TPA: AAA family ATPase, partial [Anaerolineaceae bacterium]|nr:AAA family ATPase [Anaerolineaceae bacterium]
RVNIGAALLHNPPVVMLDEPTVGIDPQSRRHILDSITELNRQGTTVLYTTHYMEEAQELSDQIAILDHGEIIACGTLRELLHLVGEQTRVELTLQGEGARAAAAWQSLAGVSQVSAVDGKVTLLTNDSNRVLPRLFESAPANDVRIQSVALQEPNLEAVFLHLTGRALRD